MTEQPAEMSPAEVEEIMIGIIDGRLVADEKFTKERAIQFLEANTDPADWPHISGTLMGLYIKREWDAKR